MSEGYDFDRRIDAAWREFRSALADRLATLSTGEVLVLGVPCADGESRLVMLDYFVAGGTLVCSTRHDALAEDHFLFDLVCGDGWVEGRDPSCFTLEVPLLLVDRAALASVTVLRDVAGVAHPSFVEAYGPDGRLALTPAMGDAPIESDPWEPPVIEFPRDADELRAAVERVLTGRFGVAPEVDEDGDYVVRLDRFTTYLLPHPTYPQVRILVPLLRDITGRTRAAEVISDLNNRYSFIRLALVSDQINAVIDVPGSPFSGTQLCDHLDHLEGYLRTLDDDFAERLGGRFRSGGAPEPDDADETLEEWEDDSLPSDLLTLIHLDAEARGALGAEQVAEVCGHDREAILDYLRICTQQVVAWHQSADESSAADDRDEYDACIHEANGWQLTADSLRAALHVIALRRPPVPQRDSTPPRQGTRFEHPEQPGLFD